MEPGGHALAVNVGHLQVRDLGHPQARAVGDAERGLVPEAGRGFEETRHLVLAQHDRRPARCVHGRQMTDEVGPFERHVEKEPQRGDGGVDGRNARLRQASSVAMAFFEQRPQSLQTHGGRQSIERADNDQEEVAVSAGSAIVPGDQ